MIREDAFTFRKQEFMEQLGDIDELSYDSLKEDLDGLEGPSDCSLIGGLECEGYVRIPERLILWTTVEPYYEEMLTVSMGNRYWKPYQQFRPDPYTGNTVNLYDTMVSWDITWREDAWPSSDDSYIRGEDECAQVVYDKGFLRAAAPDIPFMVDPVPYVPTATVFPYRITEIWTSNGSCLTIIPGGIGNEGKIKIDIDEECIKDLIKEWLQGLSKDVSIGTSSKVFVLNGSTLGWASVTEC